MSTRLVDIVVDARDPAALGRFWSDALGWPIVVSEPDEVALIDPESGLSFVCVPVAQPTRGEIMVHLDLASTSVDDQASVIARLESLGASPLDVGQPPNSQWVVLSDPEGNPFCVLDPREMYRATGPIASIAVAARDPHAVAPFWIAASGWTVAQNEDDVVALRHPSGTGPFLEFLRRPGLTSHTTKNSIHLDVRPFATDALDAEVDRLLSVGGARVDVGQGDVSWAVLADPEGNELCVLTPRD